MLTLNTSIDSVRNTEHGLFFFDRTCNAIWKSDKSFCKIEFLRGVSSDVKLKQFAAFGIFRHEDSLFIGSQIGLDILEYRLLENYFCQYGLPRCNRFEKEIYNNIAYRNKIFQFPVVMNHPVWIFDMKSKQYVEINPITQNKRNSGFIFQEGAKVYIPEAGEKTVYEFDMETLEIKNIIFSRHIPLHSICSMQGALYAIDKNQEKLWKKEQDSSETWIQMGNRKNKEAYGRLVCYGKDILMLPRWGQSLSICDTKSNQITRIKVPLEEGVKLRGSGSLFWGYYVCGSKVYFLPWILPELYVFDFIDKRFQKRYLEYKINRAFLSSLPVLLENWIGLKDFMAALQENEKAESEKIVSKPLYGQHIYESVIQMYEKE